MRPARRGQALLEWTLICPVLVLFLLFSLWLCLLAHRKLQLLEETRLLSWELTAVPTTGFGAQGSGEEVQAVSRRRFDRARAEALQASQARLQQLGSGLFEGRLQAVTADLGARTVTASDPAVVRPWGLDPAGAVAANVSLQVEAGFLPSSWLLHRLVTLQRSSAVITESWFLPDGMDSNIVPGRAGKHVDEPGPEHNSLLYRQVRRMTGRVDPLARLRLIQHLSVLPLPAFDGTFVVSHGYLANDAQGSEAVANKAARGCGPSSAHGALVGMNNAAREAGGYPGAEAQHQDAPVPELRCLDTSPFRETPNLRSGLLNHPIIDIFQHRGAHFMGCQHPMADDPTHARDLDATDRGTDKVDCE